MNFRVFVVCLLATLFAFESVNAVSSPTLQDGWLEAHSCNFSVYPTYIRGDNIIVGDYPPVSPVATLTDTVVFALSDEDSTAVVYKYQLTPRGAWSDWINASSPADVNPSVQAVSNPVAAVGPVDSLVQVFILGNDGNLYTATQVSNASFSYGFSSWSVVAAQAIPKAEGLAGKKHFVFTETATPLEVDTVSDPVVIPSADGSLYVFIRSNDTAYFAYQIASGETWTWSGWNQLGGTGVSLASNLAVALNAYTGWIEAFALMTDGELYQVWQIDSATSWAEWRKLWLIQPQMNSHPSVHNMAGSVFNGMLELFVRGQNNEMYHIWQTTCDSVHNPWSQCTWGAYYSLGSQTPANQSVMIQPKASANIHGGLEVFIRGVDGALWHVWQTEMWGKWSDWESLGAPVTGPLTSDPSVLLVNNLDYSTNSQTFNGNSANPGGGWYVIFARGSFGQLEIYLENATLTTESSAFISGQPISVSWNIPIDQASSSDRIGLYLANTTDNTDFLDFLYTGSGTQNPTNNVRSSGSMSFNVLALPDGIYEFRYLVSTPTGGLGPNSAVLFSTFSITNASENVNPTNQLFLGMAIGLGQQATNFTNCIQSGENTIDTFKLAFEQFGNRSLYAGLNSLGLGIKDFATTLQICQYTDIVQYIVKFATDLVACTEDDCAAFIIDVVDEVVIIAYECRHEIFGDIQAASNLFAINDWEDAGVNIGRVIQAIISSPN